MQVWVTVRSVATGHYFDVSLERLDQLHGAVVEVRRHTGTPHPPKPRRPKGVGVLNHRRRP